MEGSGNLTRFSAALRFRAGGMHGSCNDGPEGIVHGDPQVLSMEK